MDKNCETECQRGTTEKTFFTQSVLIKNSMIDFVSSLTLPKKTCFVIHTAHTRKYYFKFKEFFTGND